MPRFSYSAVDSTGKQVQGVLDASTENELIVRLSGQGLRIQSFSRTVPGSPERPVAAPAATRLPSPAKPKMSGSSAPVQRAPLSAAPPVAAPSGVNPPIQRQPTMTRPASAPLRGVIRTKRASRIDLHFLFVNMGNLVRSGIGAAEVFAELSRRATKQHLKEALTNLAHSASEGGSLADAMERFPDVFPPGAVGQVRAGETGGYLPEACEHLAEAFREDHRMAWKVRIMRWFLVSSFLGVPLSMAVARGLDATLTSEAKSTGPLPSLGARFGLLLHDIGAGFLGPAGILFLAFTVGYLWLAIAMKRTEARRLRHGLALKVPLVGRYGQSECIASLGWNLSKLSAGGIHPNKAWELAAHAVPNVAFAERAAATGLYTNEGTKMSEIAARSGLFPPDHQSLFFTGEMAGNLPQSLNHSADLAAQDVQRSKSLIGYSLFAVVLLISGVFYIISMDVFFSGYVNSMMKQVDNMVDN